MDLFTHYRPHRQDVVETAYVCHVCLNYRQAVTGQLLSAGSRSYLLHNLQHSLTFPFTTCRIKRI